MEKRKLRSSVYKTNFLSNVTKLYTCNYAMDIKLENEILIKHLNSFKKILKAVI